MDPALAVPGTLSSRDNADRAIHKTLHCVLAPADESAHELLHIRYIPPDKHQATG